MTGRNRVARLMRYSVTSPVPRQRTHSGATGGKPILPPRIFGSSARSASTRSAYLSITRLCKATGRASVCSTASSTRAHPQGLWVILDLHAAPGGQTGTNIDDSWGYPWLFESAAAQEATIDLWKRVAAHYRDNRTVLGYDLLNEPIPHFGGLPARYNDSLEPLYKRIVSAIREVDTNHVVILGGAQWDSSFKVFGPPFDSNSMYTFHKYWTAPTADVIREYLAYRDKYDVPIWLGESGENSDQWVADFVRTLESESVGWCFWPYKKMDQTSSVVTFAKPAHWDQIVAYAKLGGGVGAGEKKAAFRPSLENVKAAMADLLEQIKFENRRQNDGYIRALGLTITNDTTQHRRPKR